MKKTLASLLVSTAAFSAVGLPKLQQEAAGLRKDIARAQTCFPQWGAQEAAFCTGLKLGNGEILRLVHLNRDQCFDEIHQHHYKTTELVQPKSVSAHDWADFMNSTRRALTFHDPRVVAFKAGNDKVDCLHELFHVLQFTSYSSDALAPAVRAKKIADMSDELMNEAKNVAKLEKAKKTVAAQQASDQLQPILATLGDYARISDGLDEVEAHYFIYKNCSALQCTDDDLEYALANLDRRKASLPAAVAADVDAEVVKRTKEKFAKLGAEVVPTWKPFEPGEENLVQELADLEWRPLLKKITDRGAKVIAVDLKSIKPGIPFKDAIPVSLFGTLPKASDKELKLLANSKLLSGGAYGKFICGQSAPLLMITSGATRGTVIHEYLHSLQNLNNPEYCAAVSKQGEVADRFNNGAISKDDYERTIIGYQIINALAERDVYRMMIKAGDKHADALEKANNQEMLKKYEDELQFKVKADTEQ